MDPTRHPAGESDDPGDEQFLVARITEALELLERGQPVDPAALCHERPHLAARLAAACKVEQRLATLLAGEDPRLGRTLAGRYQLRRRLGQGASAVVYEAFDPSLRRPVAVKILDQAWLNGPEHIERFRREALAVAALRHDSIVAVHDQGVDPSDGSLFLVMDLVRGPDLATLLQRARVRAEAGADTRTGLLLAECFPAEMTAGAHPFWRQPYQVVAVTLLRTVAQALGVAHAAGLVHRDVKPSNILVEPTGRPVLVDFGLARLPDAATLTLSGRVLGTPWYMAPEQAGGRRAEIGPAADLYALGATLYHVLALRPPFEDDLVRVLQRIRTDEPVPLRRLRPELPRDLATVCAKAMEKRPVDRYPTMAGLAEDLTALLELRPIRAAPPGPVGRFVRLARRRPERVALLALAALLLPLLLLAAREAAAAMRGARKTAANRAWRSVPPTVTLVGRDPSQYLGPRQSDQAGKLALDRVLAADPQDDEALLLRSMCSLDQGDAGAGRADLERLARIHPESRLLPVLIARLPLLVASPDWQSRLPGELPAPEVPFDQAAAGYLWLRVRAFPETAARTGSELLRAATRSLGQESAAAHLLLVGLMLTGSDPLEAAAKQEALRGGPSARTRYVIACAYQQAQQWRAAEQAYLEVLAHCPEHDRTWHNLGIVRKQLADPDTDAMVCFEKALAIEPAAIKTLEELSKLYRDRRDWTRAEQFLGQLPADGPGAFRREQAMGRLRHAQARDARDRGEAELAQTCLGEARAALERALTLAPAEHRPRIAGDLGFVRSDLGDREGALEQILSGLGGLEHDATSLRLVAGLLEQTEGMPPGVVLHFLRAAHRADPKERPVAVALAQRLLSAADFPGAARALCATFQGEHWTEPVRALAEKVLARIPSGEAQTFLQCFDAFAGAGAFLKRPPAERVRRQLDDIARQGAPVPPALAAFLSATSRPSR